MLYIPGTRDFIPGAASDSISESSPRLALEFEHAGHGMGTHSKAEGARTARQKDMVDG